MVSGYKRLDQRIRRLNRKGELKYVDWAASGANMIGGLTLATVDAALVSQSTELNTTIISAGTSSTQRVGRTIHVTSLKMNVTFFLTDQTLLPNDLFNICRILVVKAKDANSAVSTFPLTDVLFQPNNVGVPANGSTLAVLALYNKDRFQEYKVLYDKVFNLSGPAFNLDSTPDAPYDASGKIAMNMSIKVPLGFDVQYTEGSNNPNANAVFVYFISDSIAAPHPQVVYNARLYFTDS